MKGKKLSGKEKLIKHMIGLSLGGSVLLGIIIEMIRFFNHNGILTSGLFEGVFLIHPVVLTLFNLYFFLIKIDNQQLLRKGKHIEYLTLALGSLYSLCLFPFANIQFADWTETLYNAERHTPIWTEGMTAVVVLAAAGIIGYFFLSCVNVQKVPPLLSVCAIAAMYLGIVMCILWIIQIFSADLFQLYLCLFPFNCVILGAKMVRYKVLEWKAGQTEKGKTFRNQYLNWINQKLLRADYWPIAAFLVMWPLLAVAICALILFGQQPDSIIKAWTETSDWNLSTKVAPQNVFYDEHYLCTVAAGGHRKIVKPIRMGERHGHRVIVNRQLCIANAFEQILEERTPVIHRHLRHFYDTYGFPIARLIRSPYTADLIYFIMKPLEWVFLTVLYVCDVNPENRIAVQYLPRPVSLEMGKKG